LYRDRGEERRGEEREEVRRGEMRAICLAVIAIKVNLKTTR